MKKGVPCQRFILQTLQHRWSFSFLCFNKIMLYAENFQSLLNAQLSFCKTSCFSCITRNSFSQLGTKSINLCNWNFIFWNIPKNYFAYYSNNLLIYFYFLSDCVVYATLWKMVWYAYKILFVAIRNNCNFSFCCWEANTIREQWVKLIAGKIIPFANDKTNKKLRIPFECQIGVSIPYFSFLAIRSYAIFFFFLTKLHISSTSIGDKFNSVTKYSLNFLQCSAIAEAIALIVSRWWLVIRAIARKLVFSESSLQMCIISFLLKCLWKKGVFIVRPNVLPQSVHL